MKNLIQKWIFFFEHMEKEVGLPCKSTQYIYIEGRVLLYPPTFFKLVGERVIMSNRGN
jgi:hypothetical protein